MEPTIKEIESAIAELRRKIAEYQSYIGALELLMKKRETAQQN